jgi:maltose O-acetyltransferase
MFGIVLNLLAKLKGKISVYRLKRRWNNLRELGMHLGKGVNLPMSTWIDTSHCFLISIGDNCGFGEGCAILAHDAMPNEYLDATQIGKVTIRESCHFGMRTILMPGVTIGPRSIVGSNSVVIKDIPPDSVAAGNPAKVICTMSEYLDKHRNKMQNSPQFPYSKYSLQYLNSETMREMLALLENGPGYITGGYSAMVKSGEGPLRTD